MTPRTLPRLRVGFAAITTAFCVVGCSQPSIPPPKPTKPYVGVTIRVGAVGDPKLLSLPKSQIGDWSATRGGEVVIDDSLMDAASVSGVDVVLFPGDRFADLAASGMLAQIPDEIVLQKSKPWKAGQVESKSEADPLQFDDVPVNYRQSVLKFGGKRMALPVGGSGLVLVYRKDLFEKAAKTDLAKETKVRVGPPKTWEEFDALVQFLGGRDWDGDGTVEAAIALPTLKDQEGVALGIFLARSAAVGQHRDQYTFLFNPETLAPWIGAPPFVETLEKLKQVGSLGSEGSAALDLEQARTAFRSGKVLMLVDLAERYAQWTDAKKPRPIGVAPLPGSKRIYNIERKGWEVGEEPGAAVRLAKGGGWLVGVASSSTGAKREAALDFARYLIEPDTASRIVADPSFPTLPVRQDVAAQGLPDSRSAPGVDGRLWSKAVLSMLNADVVTLDPRIRDSEGYLAELDQARENVMKGAEAQAELARVETLWNERTKRLGAKEQLRSYRLGLNDVVVEERQGGPGRGSRRP